MDKKEQFKTFVRENPEFSEHVNKGDISWQQLYEMYDLYGKDSKVWDKYKKSNSVDFSKVFIDVCNNCRQNRQYDLT